MVALRWESTFAVKQKTVSKPSHETADELRVVTVCLVADVHCGHDVVRQRFKFETQTEKVEEHLY